MNVKMYDNARVPVKSWCNEIEKSAQKQIENLSKLPFVFKQVALMPDCHMGYGMPIGGVLATKGVIIPNAVGVDIGCGMGFVETDIPVESIRDVYTPEGTGLLQAILGNIRKNVPVGFEKHKKPQESAMFDYAPELDIIQEEIDNAKFSLGTLGGGNHFIELQKNELGNLCLMLHSGSRNFGKKIADFYNKRAMELNEKYFSSVPKEWELAFLPYDSQEAKDYLIAMEYAWWFAKENRRLMIERIINVIFNMIVKYSDVKSVATISQVNIHHNYASLENHFGQNVWVHRKGATSAKKGEIGIIPGSQGTKSYIVEGLGNPESFTSCSHGAGRKMSRSAAQKNLNFENEKKILDDQGILHAIRGKGDLDEASGAYKDIGVVMASQSDLVKIVHTLTPVAVVKG